MAHFRDLKRLVRELLSADGWSGRLPELDAIPARRLTGPLFALLLDPSETVRWRAVTAFGRTMARMADSRPSDRTGGEGLEAARVVLRQCLWRLNEESGGVGWGVPEALGETLARHRRLATEYHRVLASYVREETSGEGNSLDHVPLRRGVYWALGRLAQVHPDLLERETPTLLAGLAEADGACRGLAAWTLGLLRARDAAPALEALLGDGAEVELFRDGEACTTTVNALANEALQRLASA